MASAVVIVLLGRLPSSLMWVLVSMLCGLVLHSRKPTVSRNGGCQAARKAINMDADHSSGKLLMWTGWHMAHEAHKAVTSGRVTGPEIFSTFPNTKAVPGKNWKYYSCGIHYQYTGQAALLAHSGTKTDPVEQLPDQWEPLMYWHIGPGNWMDFYPTLIGNSMCFAPVCTLHAYVDSWAQEIKNKWLYLGLCSTWTSHHKTKVAKLDCGGYCLGLWEPWQ